MVNDNQQHSEVSNLPEALSNLEVVWSSKHPGGDTYVLLDHTRKLAVAYYPEGGAPDTEVLIDSYKQLNTVSLQYNYHIASYHPSDAKIPISKKTASLNKNIFEPMRSMYFAELIIGPLFVITTSLNVKRALLPVKEFIVVIDTDDLVEGLDISKEILKLGDMRTKSDEARKLMSEIHERTGINVNFAHEAI